jgi:hypothetical protein
VTPSLEAYVRDFGRGAKTLGKAREFAESRFKGRGNARLVHGMLLNSFQNIVSLVSAARVKHCMFWSAKAGRHAQLRSRVQARLPVSVPGSKEAGRA